VAELRAFPSPSEHPRVMRRLRTEHRHWSAGRLGHDTKSPYALLDEVRKVSAGALGGERVCQCSRFPTAQGVSLMRQGGRAWVRHVATCGSVWVCPVCSGRILAARRDEIREGLEAAQRRGWGSLLLTVTFRHGADEGLADVLGDLVGIWGKVKAGGWWSKWRKRAGVVGDIAGLEVTYGYFGPHPHRHIVLIFDQQVSEPEREALEAELSERMRSVAERAGRWVSREWGVKLTRGAATYIAKMGHEVAGSVKRGHSPFELAEAAAGGDQGALLLWREYLAAMRGKRRIVWSRGLRGLLGLGDELSDEAAADREPEGEAAEVVAVLTKKQWEVVWARCAVGGVVAKALEGREAVWGFLEGLGLKCDIENLRLEALARLGSWEVSDG